MKTDFCMEKVFRKATLHNIRVLMKQLRRVKWCQSLDKHSNSKFFGRAMPWKYETQTSQNNFN